MQWLSTAHVRQRATTATMAAAGMFGRVVSELFRSRRMSIYGPFCGTLSGTYHRGRTWCDAAEQWAWSSRRHSRAVAMPRCWTPARCPRSSDWLEWVNCPQSDAELAALRKCVEREAPLETRDKGDKSNFSPE